MPELRGPTHSAAELDSIYKERFGKREAYRQQVWGVLTQYFSRWIPPDSTVLDLGCGYCEFINQIACSTKFGMDLNPEIRRRASPDVRVLEQDCSEPWPISPGSLGAVFTSNFLEHLPTKDHLERTLRNAHDALGSGGRFIAMGPNVRCVPIRYWEFVDHYLALTERSLSEMLIKCGFEVNIRVARFLPYSMSQGRTYPLWMLRTYLAAPTVWRVFGKQFLVVARKP
jgi:SAM-dependent methyltransferase